jgi:FAD/FMN-containing dehydrogenase
VSSFDRRDFLERTGKLAIAAGVVGVGPVWAEIASTGPSAAQLRLLAREVHGPVVTRDSHGYALDRLVFDTHFNSARPKAIVFCESTADVQKTVRWARKYGVRLVPRSGGHSYGGYSTISSGVVVDVTRMKFVQPRAGGRALIGAGAPLIDIYSKLWAHHRMIPGGSCPTVGIAGLTQGGGHGWSGRKFGLTSDNVTQLTIVTADGKVLTCNAHENSDLYWACRGGGGGNFGIVTNFTFKTHPVNKVSTFYLTWPWSDAARVVKAWQRWAPHAPSNLGLSVCVLSSGSPPSISASGQFFGSASALRSLIRPLTNVGSPNVSVTPRTFFGAVLLYAGCDSISACRNQAPEAFKAKSDYAHRPLSAAGIKTIVRGIEGFSSGGLALILDSYGGAINRVPPAATAFAHRDMLFSMQYYATPGSGRNLAQLNRFYRAMRPYVSGYAYQNYIDPQLANWEHAYYGTNYPRLVSVKKKYDPGNFLRFKQSIRLHT